MKIFMVFLTMYHMSWELSYLYGNSQLEIKQCTTIHAMRASDGMFKTNMKCIFSYLFNTNFLFSHNTVKVFMFFLTIYYLVWGLRYFYVVFFYCIYRIALSDFKL